MKTRRRIALDARILKEFRALLDALEQLNQTEARLLARYEAVNAQPASEPPVPAYPRMHQPRRGRRGRTQPTTPNASLWPVPGRSAAMKSRVN